MKYNSITIVFIAIVMLFFYSACSSKDSGAIDIAYNPETTPSMVTDSVITLISDSGITRYKLIADIWEVYDKAEDPYWYFPEGLYLERFDSLFQIEAKILAATAWNYTARKVWRSKGNVDIRNMEGEMFLSEELFWDQEKQTVYSDKYIQIKRGDTELKGYGFESNQEMTEYRIFRPHDGRIPFRENIESTEPSDEKNNNEEDAVTITTHE